MNNSISSTKSDDKKLSQYKFAFFLPNLFTALNIACGFVAIIYSTQSKFYEACLVIMLGALFDSVDGRVARMTGTQSQFGEQFDSLSDLISFGIAPALIYYFSFLKSFNRLGLIVAFLYLLSGALRLARFNANLKKSNSQSPSDFFQGLPIPAAALGVLSLVLLSSKYEIRGYLYYFFPVYLFFYAVLMISNFPFPSFKKSEWVKRNKKKTLIIIICLLVLLFLDEVVMTIFYVNMYVLASLVYYLMNRSRMKRDMFDWEDRLDENL